jgi:divalent metal cation (Fe/Co/Zn/Cd) transporter
LSIGLIAGVVVAVFRKTSPETTIAGIIISGISNLSMLFLMMYKLKAGKMLQSDAIIADAHCTRTCLYLSIVLLLSSTLYEVFAVSYIDLAGSLGIAWFVFSEGREALKKNRSNALACSCCDDH